MTSECLHECLYIRGVLGLSEVEVPGRRFITQGVPQHGEEGQSPPRPS